MNHPPAFLLCVRDRLIFRVARMSYAAQGVLLRLECLMWLNGTDQCSLPDNDEQISRALGVTVEEWMQYRKEIQAESDPIFEEKDGLLISGYLKSEASRLRKHRKSQAEKGRKSAQARLSRGSAAVEPEQEPGSNPPIYIYTSTSSFSSSSSSSKEEDKKKKEKRSPLSEDEWLASLRGNLAYRHLDIDLELAKARAWISAHTGRQFTRRFFLRWLNKARPVAPNANHNHKESIVARRLSELMEGAGWTPSTLKPGG